MQIPSDLSYSGDHLWVRAGDDSNVTVGITDYAQDQLGQVIFVDLPAEGDEVEAGVDMGAVESAKSVSDLIAPISGRVVEVNTALEDNPAALNEDPYQSGWLAVIEPAEGGMDGLMDAAAYEKATSE